jgi:vancomycin resistance protein VanJ
MLRHGVSFLLWSFGCLLAGYLFLRLVFGDSLWWLAWLNNFTPYYFLPLLISFPLALGLRRHRLSIVHFLLLSIGIVWFLPRFTHGLSTPAVSAPRLTIVTFNVWGDNSQLEDVIDWLRETNADVVLLQEIPPAWSGVTIAEIHDLYPYQVSQPLEVRVWGNAVLSRYPILNHQGYVGGETVTRERIEIEWEGQTIVVYNVHLTMPQRETPHFSLPINNPFLNMALKYDDAIRNSQIDRLLTNLEQENHPLIVTGDFNISDHAVKYEAIARVLNDSFREVGFGMGASWPHAEIAGFPSFVPPLLRIDYVWHSDAFRAVNAEVGPALGSDHLPVVTVLEWRGTQ